MEGVVRIGCNRSSNNRYYALQATSRTSTTRTTASTIWWPPLVFSWQSFGASS